MVVLRSSGISFDLKSDDAGSGLDHKAVTPPSELHVMCVAEGQ